MSGLEAIAERVAAGAAITEADATAVLEARDLIAVGALADDARRRRHGAATTFVRVFEVHVEAPVESLPPRVHAGEFRIVGAPADADAAVKAVANTVRLAGSTPVTGFSVTRLQDLAGSDAAFEELCKRLRDAGLTAIAELHVDTTPGPEAAVAQVRRAGLEILRLTVHGTAQPSALAVVAHARDLQAACGGFRAFAPLPQNVPVSAPTTGYDDVKLVAAARLLAADIPSIQVDWVQYGPKLAQVALTTGADDVDRIAAVDPGLLGTRRSPIEEIKGNIRAAGLEAVERDGRFQTLAGEHSAS